MENLRSRGNAFCCLLKFRPGAFLCDLHSRLRFKPVIQSGGIHVSIWALTINFTICFNIPLFKATLLCFVSNNLWICRFDLFRMRLLGLKFMPHIWYISLAHPTTGTNKNSPTPFRLAHSPIYCRPCIVGGYLWRLCTTCLLAET